jgi:hypothetical protein
MRHLFAAALVLPLAACAGVFEDDIAQRCQSLEDPVQQQECYEMLEAERAAREAQGAQQPGPEMPQ